MKICTMCLQVTKAQTDELSRKARSLHDVHNMEEPPPFFDMGHNPFAWDNDALFAGVLGRLCSVRDVWNPIHFCVD